MVDQLSEHNIFAVPMNSTFHTEKSTGVYFTFNFVEHLEMYIQILDKFPTTHLLR